MYAFFDFVAKTLALVIVIIVLFGATVFVTSYETAKSICGDEFNKTCFVVLQTEK